ncbi:MAG TPA: YihY/virulence factor BrkB family protein [Sphingomicrobium sp.]|nr:YihY/virulence factor BrkB family protein [Sphingomicrobium sp.]
MAGLADKAVKAATAPPGEKGQEAKTPAQIPAPGWKEIAFRTWSESSKDNISLVAAGVAFYGFLAMVPLLGATVLTYGLVASPDTVLHNVGSLAKTMPHDIAKLIGDQLMNVVKTSGSKKGLGLVAALLLALWGARNAAGSVIIALNIAYEEEEKRSWLKVTLLSLEITLAAVLLAMVGAAAIGAMVALERLLPSMGRLGVLSGQVLAYVLLAALAAAAAATLYRYGPSRREAKWAWLTPGSAFFALAWVVLTLGFGFYVSRFGKYNLTYGSLGGVVILVTWLYLSSFVLLFGAEFNSEVEHQTARDTTADPGERPLGERGAWSADHVADGPDDKGKEGESEKPLSDDPGAREESETGAGTTPSSGDGHPYLAARLTNRAAGIAGFKKVGMVSAACSTIGLSLLRRRGRELAGAALVATAVGLSLLKREE